MPINNDLYPNSYISAIGDFKNEPVIYEALEQYLHVDTVKPQIKAYIKQILEYVDQQGKFPSKETLIEQLGEPSPEVHNVDEAEYQLKRYLRKLQSMSLSNSLMQALTTADDKAEYDPAVLSSCIQEVLDKADFTTTTGAIVEKDWCFTEVATTVDSAISTGIKDIDGFIAGGKGLLQHQISTICAFTSHGKSTWANSIAYNALKEGKKVLFFTLEVAWQELSGQLQSRWLFDRGVTGGNGKPIPPTAISGNTLPDSARDYIRTHKDEMDAEVFKNAYFSSFDEDDPRIFKSSTMFKNKLQAVAQYLGGLDLIVIDHVTLFSTVSGDYKIGNMILSTIRDVVKDFEYEGNGVHTIWCAQMNRTGHKSAGDSNIPSLISVAELSEIERSSHQVFVMRTDEDDRVNQTTRIYILKNRGGRITTDAFTPRFVPELTLVGFEDSGSNAPTFEASFDDSAFGFNF